MKTIYFIIVFFIPFFGFTQFSVSGKLVNNTVPVSNCPIKLTKSGEVVKVSISDENGIFVFQDISQGEYVIEIVSIFYETVRKKITIQDNISLGDITVNEKKQELEEVVVSEKKKPITFTESGTFVDVVGSRLSNRENIFSILDYVPSISTTSGLKIYGSDDISVVLDGKELNLDKDKIAVFLSKISVKSIESIEVIDRVDASVDASKSGVIKINTIKKDGWSGTLSKSVFQRKKIGYTDDAGLFYTTDSYRIFGTLYHSRSKSFYNDISHQLLRNQNITYNNTANAEIKRKENGVVFGVDYYLNKNSELSLLYLFNYDSDDNHKRNAQTDIFRNNVFDYYLTSRRLFDQTSKDHTISLNFNSNLDSLNSNIKIAFDFMNKKYNNPLFEEEIYYQSPYTTKLDEQNSSSNSFVYAFSTTWNKKFSNKKQVSLGTRLSLVDNKDYFDYLDIVNDQRIKNTTFSNNFFLKEYIVAFFSKYNFPIGKKSSMALGVRTEYNYNDFTNELEHYNNDNTRLLFSALFNTKLWGNIFYISALQRLNRVNYNSFNPTYIKNSPTTAYVGNKDLNPTDIYQLQTGYKVSIVNFGLIYRYYENNVLFRPNNINGVLTTRPENVGYRNDFYIFASTFYKFNDWWEANLKLTGGYSNFKLPEKKFNSLLGELHLFQRFYLPWEDMEIGLNYFYNSNYQRLYTKYFYNNSVNIYLFYPISDSFKLNIFVNDIFDTSRSKSEYNFNSIYNYSYNKANTRSFGLSLTYEFSKGKEVDDSVRENEIKSETSRLR